MSDKLDALRHDVEYALRQIARAPGLAVAVIATFALGIGANATMFGVIDRLLLRPPAHVRAPEELYRIEIRGRYQDEEYTSSAMSYPAYTDFRDHVAGFASVAAQTYPNPMSLGLGASARKISGVLVSGTYFSTLGVPMIAGRALVPGDDILPNGSPVVVIGEGLWQREFGRDPAIEKQSRSRAGSSRSSASRLTGSSAFKAAQSTCGCPSPRLRDFGSAGVPGRQIARVNGCQSSRGSSQV